MGRLRNSINNRRILKPNKVAERLGRLRERYPFIARYYDIETILNDESKEVRDISWVRKDSRAERSVLTGCYVIEISHNELSAEQIWNIYNTLVQVEYSFHCLKTDLGFRPIYHHKANHTEGHLFISVLAYHLLISIETKLWDQGDTRKWSTIREELSTYQRNTVSMMDKDGYIHHIRVSCRQEPVHVDIFRKLNIKDPSKRIHKSMKMNSL
jgi:transposase